MIAKKLTLLLFLLLSVNIAQTKEIYFPEAVGNVWQYQYNDGTIFKDLIVKDSLLADSSKLILVLNPVLKKDNTETWSYWVSKNQDSVIQYPNDINILLYKFPMEPGDKWMLWDSVNQRGIMGHCWGEFDASIFGLTKKGFYVDYYSKYEIDDTSTTFHSWFWREIIADGFGKIWWGNEVEFYTLMGCIIDGVKYGTITEVENIRQVNNPGEYTLYQNYPNPFNPTTTISYEIPSAGNVTLKVYDLLGGEVETLVNGFNSAGTHEINFNGNKLSSGMYFYELRAGDFVSTKKMMLTK